MYVGSISVEKRLEDVTTLLRERPNTVFAIVGGGPHEAELRKHFSEFGDRVNFVGVLRGDDLSKAHVRRADFVSNESRLPGPWIFRGGL